MPSLPPTSTKLDTNGETQSNTLSMLIGFQRFKTVQYDCVMSQHGFGQSRTRLQSCRKMVVGMLFLSIEEDARVVSAASM